MWHHWLELSMSHNTSQALQRVYDVRFELNLSV